MAKDIRKIKKYINFKDLNELLEEVNVGDLIRIYNTNKYG